MCYVVEGLCVLLLTSLLHDKVFDTWRVTKRYLDSTCTGPNTWPMRCLYKVRTRHLDMICQPVECIKSAAKVAWPGISGRVVHGNA